jgi:hypothetical protein
MGAFALVPPELPELAELQAASASGAASRSASTPDRAGRAGRAGPAGLPRKLMTVSLALAANHFSFRLAMIHCR